MLDLLNRDEFIKVVENIIYSTIKNNEKACIAIDGAWGSGKSWVINNLVEKLTSDNENKYNCFPIIYNCWENDYYKEPLIGILNSILSINKKINNSSKIFDWVSKLGSVALDITSLLSIIGIPGTNIANAAINIAKNAADEINDKLDYKDMDISEKLKLVNKYLNKITNEMPIVFIVDEIDRTLPEYAIKVLERLHHIFNNVRNCITIVATDKHQLDKSIKDIYGIDDDSRVDLYFKKFFDFRLTLDNGEFNYSNYDDFNKEIFESLGLKNDEYHSRSNIINTLMEPFDIRCKMKILDRTLSLYKLLNYPLKHDSLHDGIYLTIFIFVALYEGKDILNYVEYIDNKIKQGIEKRNSRSFMTNLNPTMLNGSHLDVVIYSYYKIRNERNKFSVLDDKFYEIIDKVILNLNEMYKYME